MAPTTMATVRGPGKMSVLKAKSKISGVAEVKPAVVAFSGDSGLLTLQSESNSKGLCSIPGECGANNYSAFISEGYVLMAEKKVVIKILRGTEGISEPEPLVSVPATKALFGMILLRSSSLDKCNIGA